MFLIALSNTRYMQYVAALAGSFAISSSIAYTSWPSPALPKLRSNDSPITKMVSDDELSWIVSSFLLGGIVSTLIAIPVVKNFGPKRTLLISCVGLLVPWFVIIFAESVLLLCCGRFIAGLASGPILPAITIYNSEIGEKDIRGKLGLAFTIMKLLGHSVVLTIGPFVSYLTLCIICAALPSICFAVFYFMPESPYHLIKTNQKEQARMNLVKLSSNDVDNIFIEKRIIEIEQTIENDLKHKSTIRDILTNKVYRKPFIIIFVIKTIQQLSGGIAIESYMQTIIESSESSISPETSSVIFGLIQFPVAFMTAAVVDKLGRKPLMFISAIGCAVGLLAEGGYFYIQDAIGGNVSSITWLPTTGIIVFLLMSPLGVSSLPFVLMGELFPTNIKEVAVTIMAFYNVTLSFAISKLFYPVTNELGLYTTFWIFGGSCILGALYVVIFLPETKGKSFGDIQTKLNRNKSNKEATNTEA